MREDKIYKSTYFIYAEVTFVISLIGLFIAPFLEGRKFSIHRYLLIIILMLFYLFGKKRISKIVIDELNEIIKIQVSHFFFLRQNTYSYCIQDIKFKEYERYFSGTTFAPIFEICIENNISFEINTLTDGWSQKTLDKIKVDIEKITKQYKH